MGLERDGHAHVATEPGAVGSVEPGEGVLKVAQLLVGELQGWGVLAGLAVARQTPQGSEFVPVRQQSIAIGEPLSYAGGGGGVGEEGRMQDVGEAEALGEAARMVGEDPQFA